MGHTLEIDSVLLRFGERTVLQDVYLRCQTGRETGLLGRNGSGKTCLMRLMTGELRGGQCFVRIDDRRLTARSRRADDITYMPQRHFIPFFLAVGRVLRDYGLDGGELVVWFPVFEGRMGVLAGELSGGGELRLLEFFIVICSDAKFAILDEPFSHVMPVNVAAVEALIREQSRHKGVLLSDHLFRHVTGVCDDIYVATDGAVRWAGGRDDLIRYGYLSENFAE